MSNLPQDPAEGTPWVEVVNNFAQIPEALLCDPRVTDGAIRVYGVLHRHGTDPSNCYPGHRRIAEMTGKQPRSIQRLVRELEISGWVERVPRNGPDGSPTSNGYRLHDRALVRGVRAEERVPLPAPVRAPSAQDRAPKESQLNESQLNDALVVQQPPLSLVVPDPFDEFWEVFPLKKGKPAARRAWAKALKNGARPSEVIAGARSYAEDPKRDISFTKYPQGWLNDERWNDVAAARPKVIDNNGQEKFFLPGSGWISRR